MFNSSFAKLNSGRFVVLKAENAYVITLNPSFISFSFEVSFFIVYHYVMVLDYTIVLVIGQESIYPWHHCKHSQFRSGVMSVLEVARVEITRPVAFPASSPCTSPNSVWNLLTY